MKNVKVFDKTGNLISDNNRYEDPLAFIDFNKSINTWGKGERWVRAKLFRDFAVSEANPDGDYFLDEPYLDESVITTEKRTEPAQSLTIDGGLPAIIEVEYVKLKADYTIEIVDISEEIRQKKIAEIKKEIDSYLDIFCDNNFSYPVVKDGNSVTVPFQANRQTLYDATSSLTILDHLPKNGSVPYVWRSKDNVNRVFSTFEEFKAFVISMGLFYNKMFQIRSVLKDSLSGLTLDALQAIDSSSIEDNWDSLL